MRRRRLNVAGDAVGVAVDGDRLDTQFFARAITRTAISPRFATRTLLNISRICGSRGAGRYGCTPAGDGAKIRFAGDAADFDPYHSVASADVCIDCLARSNPSYAAFCDVCLARISD